MSSSTKQTDDFPFQAKDSLWYKSYQDMVNANIQHNARHLESLGFGVNKPTRKKSPSKSNNRKRSQPTAPTRVSKRVRTAPPELKMTALDVMLDRLESKPTRPKKNIRTAGTKSNSYKTLTAQQLTHLRTYFEKNQKQKKGIVGPPEGDNEWMRDMHEWLLKVPHGPGRKTVGTENATSVMRQVRKLVLDGQKGKGVPYHHWPDHVSFCWWRPVPDPDEPSSFQKNGRPDCHILARDIRDIYNLAQEMEDTFGRDLGNGW
jgi:hypothetical protein